MKIPTRIWFAIDRYSEKQQQKCVCFHTGIKAFIKLYTSKVKLNKKIIMIDRLDWIQPIIISHCTHTYHIKLILIQFLLLLLEKTINLNRMFRSIKINCFQFDADLNPIYEHEHLRYKRIRYNKWNSFLWQSPQIVKRTTSPSK